MRYLILAGFLTAGAVLCFPTSTNPSVLVISGEEVRTCSKNCRNVGGIYAISNRGGCLCSDNVSEAGWTTP